MDGQPIHNRNFYKYHVSPTKFDRITFPKDMEVQSYVQQAFQNSPLKKSKLLQRKNRDANIKFRSLNQSMNQMKFKDSQDSELRYQLEMFNEKSRPFTSKRYQHKSIRNRISSDHLNQILSHDEIQKTAEI